MKFTCGFLVLALLCTVSLGDQQSSPDTATAQESLTSTTDVATEGQTTKGEASTPAEGSTSSSDNVPSHQSSTQTSTPSESNESSTTTSDSNGIAPSLIICSNLLLLSLFK